MRERRRELASSSTTTTASIVERVEDCSCEDASGTRGCFPCAGREDGSLMMTMTTTTTTRRRSSKRRSSRNGMLDAREQGISLTPPPSLVLTIEASPSTSSQSRTLSTRSSTSLRRRRVASSTPEAPSATTIVTVTVTTKPTTHFLPPRTASSTRTFTPTGYQSVVPTYPPFTSSSSSSTSTTNWSSLATKLGLGLGIPFLVLLTLLLTIVLHRHQVRRAKHLHHHHHHRKPPSPGMATIMSTTEPAYPRLHPVPSSCLSAAGDVVVTPAPGILSSHPTPGTGIMGRRSRSSTSTSTPMQLYFPPPPSPPPAVPRRSSARLLAGPLTSHPPVRPTSSIYDGENARRESVIALGGNGVGDVLAEYLDLSPQHLEGPWDPDQLHVPALVLPPKPVARNRQQDQRRQYLSVDVHHSPGGIEEVSPLSSAGSGPHVPARISVMSGLSPSSPVRIQSRRGT